MNAVLRKFLATTRIAGCETRAVFAPDAHKAEAMASQGKYGRVDRDVVERIILVEDLGAAPEGSIEGPWWPEGVPRPEVCLFMKEHRLDASTDAHSSRESAERAARWWVQETWKYLGLDQPIPKELDEALDVLRERGISCSIQEVPLDPVPYANTAPLAELSQMQAATDPSHAKRHEAQEEAWTRTFEALDATELGMELGHMVDAMDQLRRGVRPISERAWRRFQVLALVIDRRLRGEVAPQ